MSYASATQLQLGDPNQDCILGPSGRGFVYVFSVSIRLFVCFLCSPRNFSKWQGAALGQKCLKNQSFVISCPGGPVGQNTKCTKVAQFLGETLGQADFPQKSVPSSGKLRCSVPSPELLYVPRGCPRPKGPAIPVFCHFPPAGVRSVQTQQVKKVADNHPG